MSVLIALAALGLLMLAAYRGYSVILFAPIAALGAVLVTDPGAVGPAFTGLFMEKMVGFVKLYFPVFLLGAVFGKLIELSGFSRSIVAAAINILGRRHAIPVIVLVCALLTYGGVSLFVVAFAVYPFAAELFRQSNIPKRLIPATVALGAFSFTMDALPGTPQIQNIIPTSFFGTNAWAAPWLGLIGSLFIIAVGLIYLERQRRKAQAKNEGYGTELLNEPETPDNINLPNPLIAISPLILVGLLNLLFTWWIPVWYGASHQLELPGLAAPITTDVAKITAIWAVEAALIAAAHAANIPLEVFHRVASMASGGMDTLPHNGAVITLLAITGLSHRQAYGGIFAITIIKSLAVLFIIGVYYTTGIV